MTYQDLKNAKAKCEKNIKDIDEKIKNLRAKKDKEKIKLAELENQIQLEKMLNILKSTKDENGVSGYDKFMQMK